MKDPVITGVVGIGRDAERVSVGRGILMSLEESRLPSVDKVMYARHGRARKSARPGDYR